MDTSREAEASLGDQSFAEVTQQYRRQILPASHPDARFVQSVVDRIVQSNALEPPGKDSWQTFVIKDETKNAFVTPGGHIFVFTGILPVAKDADGLAVILGHGELARRGVATLLGRDADRFVFAEIAHQVARHSAERYSSMKVSSLARPHHAPELS